MKEKNLHSVPTGHKTKKNKNIINRTYEVEKEKPGPSKSTSILAASSSPPVEEDSDSHPELPPELLSGPDCDSKPNVESLLGDD